MPGGSSPLVQALTHPQRVALHAPIGRIRQTNRVEHLVDACGRVSAADREDAEVVACAATGMKRGVVEDRADVRRGPIEPVVATDAIRQPADPAALAEKIVRPSPRVRRPIVVAGSD